MVELPAPGARAALPLVVLHVGDAAFGSVVRSVNGLLVCWEARGLVNGRCSYIQELPTVQAAS